MNAVIIIFLLFKALVTVILVVFAFGRWNQEGASTGVMTVLFCGVLVWMIWIGSWDYFFAPNGELGL